MDDYLKNLAELTAKGFWPEIEAIKLTAAARGDTRAGVQWRKAMSALAGDGHAR